MTIRPSWNGYIRSLRWESQNNPRQSEHSNAGCGPQPSSPQSRALFRCATRALYSRWRSRSSFLRRHAFRVQTASCPSAKCVWSAQKSRPQYWQACSERFGQREKRPPMRQGASGMRLSNQRISAVNRDESNGTRSITGKSTRTPRPRRQPRCSPPGARPRLGRTAPLPPHSIPPPRTSRPGSGKVHLDVPRL